MKIKKAYLISIIIPIIIILYLGVTGCNGGNCDNTKIIFKITEYVTDMCPDPADCYEIHGDFNTDYSNGDGTGQGWYNHNYVSIPFTIEKSGAGWTEGGSFEITQEGDCIDLDGVHGPHYRCTSGKIPVPPIPCNQTRVIETNMFCMCD